MHVKHRETARVILRDEQNRVLMFFTHWDPGTGLPPRWLTPGGGLDEGETILQAAVRELREETGMVVEPKVLGELVHSIAFELEWMTVPPDAPVGTIGNEPSGKIETGVAHLYDLQIAESFTPGTGEWTQDEHRDILQHRWWNIEDLASSGEMVGPPGLLEFLQSHLAR
jgi:8-oxo-dGTP pyrophosphatase MutT (NUDIX family)